MDSSHRECEMGWSCVFELTVLSSRNEKVTKLTVSTYLYIWRWIYGNSTIGYKDVYISVIVHHLYIYTYNY
jgi:hypothetical protein